MPDTKRNRGKQIGREFLFGLLVITLLFLLKLWVEQTTLGKQFHLMSYNLLQSELSTNHENDDEIPITIVDISDLPPSSFTIDGQSYTATPRESIYELVKASAEQGPVAIGVDIDFSPNENGWITPKDPEFFQSILDLRDKTKVPIFLGIKRSQTLPPEEWLGVEDYQELAANIVIPNDSEKMLQWISISESAKRGPTMSAALANAFEQSKDDLPEWIHWAVEQISTKKVEQKFSVGEFLVDYSPLDFLEKNKLRTKNPEVVKDQGEKLNNRIVFLGDATLLDGVDHFDVSVKKSVPGVYLHACAAYTLIKAPLYELTPKGRLTIDFILSMGILISVIGLRLYYKNRTSKTVATRRLQYLFTLLVVVMAIIVGVLFVSTTRVMWDDFMLVIFALLLHPSIERHLEKFIRKIKDRSSIILHKLIFEQDEESE